MIAHPSRASNGLLVTLSNHLEPTEIGRCNPTGSTIFSACFRGRKKLFLASTCKAQKRSVTPHSVLEELHYLRDIIAGEVDLCGWSVELIGKDGKKRGKRVGTVDEIIELALVEGRSHDDDAVLRPFEASVMGGTSGSDPDSREVSQPQGDRDNGSRVRGPRELLLRVVGEEEVHQAKSKKQGSGNVQTKEGESGVTDDRLDGSVGVVMAHGSAGTPDHDKVEHLIPLVPSIVVRVDVKRRCLTVSPPQGLLELGRQQHHLQRLLPGLMDFCEERGREKEREWREGEAALLSDGEGKDSVVAAPSQSLSQHLTYRMPTHSELLAAGRHDLIADIRAAGGYLAVAAQFGWVASRRPAGFWEDLQNVDAEISEFIAGMQTEHSGRGVGRGSGGTHYRDRVDSERRTGNHTGSDIGIDSESSTGSDSEAFLPPPSQLDPSLLDPDGSMPRVADLLAAGRYDLHHAIKLHGGYRLVAQELGRLPLRAAPSALPTVAGQVHAFMAARGMRCFPRMAHLRAEGGEELAAAVRRVGGATAVADRLGVRMERRGRGHWRDEREAVRAVKGYLVEVWALGAAVSGSRTRRGRCGRQDISTGSCVLVASNNLHGQEMSEHGSAVSNNDDGGASDDNDVYIDDVDDIDDDEEEEVEDVWEAARMAGLLDCRERRRIPSDTVLLSHGRADIRYVLQKFGRKRIMAALGIGGRL